MSRILTALLLAMLVLVGAMGLKTVVMAHSDGAIIMANGGGSPVPPVLFKSGGGAPPPPMPYKSGGGAPPPPMPY